MAGDLNQGGRGPNDRHQGEAGPGDPIGDDGRMKGDHRERCRCLDEHQWTNDHGDPSRVLCLIVGECLLADIGEEWIVNNLDGPDQTGQEAGRGNLNQQYEI